MKKITFIIVCFALAGSVQSCKKNALPDTVASSNPIAKIAATWADTSSDFFVTISSSYGVSVYGAAESAKQPTAVVEAASIKEQNVGDLKVNGVEIPFNQLSYWKECDTSAFLPSVILGKNNNYQLSGNNFPSFNLNQYSPNYTNLTFSGLVNYKLPRNTTLTMNWVPDEKLPDSSTAAILLLAEDSSHLIKSVEIPVTDNLGSYTISTSQLSQFANYPYVRVLYFRGYDQIHNINNKTIDLRFVTFSYAWINFSN